MIDQAKIEEWKAKHEEWLRGGRITNNGVRIFEALLAERDEMLALFDYDPAMRTVKIAGVRYDMALFEKLGILPTGKWVRIEGRRDEVITLHVEDESPALALLREVEWSGGDDADMCPVCSGWRSTEKDRRAFDAHQGLKHWGHAPDCRLAAALKGAP